MTAVRLTLEYDGTGFSGWAAQPEKPVPSYSSVSLTRVTLEPYPNPSNTVLLGLLASGLDLLVGKL